MSNMPAFIEKTPWAGREIQANHQLSDVGVFPELVKSAPNKRGRKAATTTLPPPTSRNRPSTKGEARDSSRAERSLGLLTKQFIGLLKDENGSLDLNKTAETLKVQKRRIYDITNVLEGIELIEKSKNTVRWKPTNNSSLTNNQDALANKQRMEKLRQDHQRALEENAELLRLKAQADQSIRDTLTNPETRRYAYVTPSDLKSIDSLQGSMILAVSTPYETYMQIDESADPSHPFVLNLEHQSKAGEVDFTHFAVPPRCPGSPFQSSSESSSSEGPSDYSSFDEDSDGSYGSDTDYSSGDSCSESDYSSSSSSSEDEGDDRPARQSKFVVGTKTFVSDLSRQDISEIAQTAFHEMENDVEYMSE
ncbi:Transcription factor e2f2 [Actinomortierella ambigua]|nr:Transcription factor e2f2 [Actinomortierella ambigua]